jgi:hypothetical protein
MPTSDANARRPRGPGRRPPDPRTIVRLLYLAVAVIALLLIYVAVRAALN